MSVPPHLVALAPMSGLTDVPFRRIARRYEALLCTEMVAAGPLISRREVDVLKAEADTGGAPLVVQLAGCDARWIAEAAKCSEANGATAIDLNMGCPSKKVIGGQAGSALMRDLDHACSLIAAAVSAVRIPVSVKMRLGWDSASHNAAELTRRAREIGVNRVAVHGRTRCQFYDGQADWEAVRPVVDTGIGQVLVNGDIDGVATARTALAESGASGVMVGRKAIGQPWLLGQIASALDSRCSTQPTVQQQRDIALEHMEASVSFYGIEHGLRVFRKHLSAYLAHAGAARATVASACQREGVAAVGAAIRDHFDQADSREAA